MPPAQATFPSSPNGVRHDVGFEICLPPRPASTADARHVIRRRLGELLDDETLDDVLLVVSELVTNAVLYGHGDVTLQMGFDGGCVSGTVGDEGSGFTLTARELDSLQVGGHGLAIVGRIASGWGLREGSSHVWFQVSARRRR
ncbi:MAG: ATP-binding protein [Solirubrobacteraceae bacterium]